MYSTIYTHSILGKFIKVSLLSLVAPPPSVLLDTVLEKSIVVKRIAIIINETYIVERIQFYKTTNYQCI